MRMMVMIGALVCGIGAAYAQGSAGDTTGGAADTTGMQKKDLSMKDRQFLMKAASGGVTEVRAAQMAVDKAQNEQLKTAAQRILDDHQRANDQLKAIAAQHDIALPTEPSSEDRQSLQKLQRASGAEFDRVYKSELMKDHEKDIAEFQRAAREVQDPQLREFATNTLPVLRQHHQLIMGVGHGGKQMRQPSGGSDTMPPSSGSDVERR